jgi:hypothetical protein
MPLIRILKMRVGFGLQITSKREKTKENEISHF